MSVISTSQTTTETLSTIGDDLLVTSSGSIIVTTSAANGVDATADNQEITIDGLVYSIDNYTDTGVKITGEVTALTVNGQVQGDVAVDVDEGTSDHISVGSQGAISGDFDGVLFLGNSAEPAKTDNALVNAGDIAGNINGVVAEDGGGDVIDNSGQISGANGVDFLGNVGIETVENSGTLAGGADVNSAGSAIITTQSSAGIDVVNSGLLTNSGPNALDTNTGVLYFDDNSEPASTIDNTGSISGAGYVIQSNSDILVISNSGTIHGGLFSTSAVAITTNSGLWEVSSGSSTVFTLAAAGDSISNSRAGTIDGAISIASGGDTITNAGGIDGPITFTGSGNTNSLTNSDEITGAVAFSGGFNTVDNSGLIDGEVSIAHSHDVFTNAGTIDGLVSIPAGSDTITNGGTIDGQLMLWSTGTNNSVTNAGDIVGDVTLPGTSSLINSGIIHGNVTLGASDTFDLSPGIVTGMVNAGASDLFEFSGDFGKVTFDDFVAGTGSTHDTIQFAANDFGTFAQVQSASSQVGADVVIKLDATDSITLNSATLASLVSADFSFV